jgi:Beta-lactamase class D
MRLGLATFVMTFVVHICPALEWREDAGALSVFREYGITGAFVLYDVSNNVFVGSNLERAARRYIPSSTFKIANTLIGLASGAVASVDEVLPFVGGADDNPAWRKNMSLRDAIRISNVPIYRELARRIGGQAMGEGLRRLCYGNMDIGDRVDEFWLRGPLAISAIEQCRFLASLAVKELPIAPEIQTSVREIIFQRDDDGTLLFAKTGAARNSAAWIGWWVGWVEKDGRVYPFAMNMDMPDFDSGLPLRSKIGEKCLKTLGIL